MNAWRRVKTVAETQGRDLLRHRLALAMLVVLPAAMYLSVAGEQSKIRPGEDPFPLKVGVIGIAWTIAGAAFFLGLSSRRVDERLILAGYRRAELAIGRVVFLLVLTLPLVIVHSVLVTSSSHGDSGPIVLAVASSAVVGLALGLALAAVLPRELEGSLALIAIVGVQISLPIHSTVSAAMPLHGPIRLAGVAWDSAGSVMPPLLHAAAAAAILLALFIARWGRQLQPKRRRRLGLASRPISPGVR